MAYLRLRQICLVASDLAQAERQIAHVLGLEVCFRDPGVGKYGLRNALFARAGTFLEVVSPIQPNTAAGRYIERRKGDGGYMYIVDCDDLERRRQHFIRHGVRLGRRPHIQRGRPDRRSAAPASARHRRLPAFRRSPFAGRRQPARRLQMGRPDWQAHDRSQTISIIVGAGIQSAHPAALAARWSELLERPVGRANEGDALEIRLDQAFVRFGQLHDDRGDGLRSVHLKCKDKAAILAAADRAGIHRGEDYVDLVGVRFMLA